MAGIFKAYDIRGIYPDQIDETVAYRVGYHFRRLLDEHDLADSNEVVVSRDMRSHSVPLCEALKRGLRAAGLDVVDIGLADTPRNYFAIGHLKTAAGIQVTASHNAKQYNGLKMSRRDAVPISNETGIGLLEKLVTGEPVPGDLPLRGAERSADVWPAYRDHALGFLVSAKPRLKVGIDFANGMGATYLPLLPELGLELVTLYEELDGTFPNHEANPLKDENLVDIQRLVREQKCDLGLAFDGDADRVRFIDGNGKAVGADMITGLLAPRYLRKEPGAAIVYDLRSSWATREAIEAAGGKAVRERVGHSFMKATMRRLGSPFGGELAGHFYHRASYTADSTLLTLVEVLNHLRETGKPLSELVAPLERYFTTGEINFHVADKEEMIRRLAEIFADGKIDHLDGITVEYADWWFNVRPSNTEPLLRLVLEARTAELCAESKGRLLGILGEPV